MELKSIGKDEMYCEWFVCPDCKGENIAEHFKFCPDCGLNLEGFTKKSL